MVFLIRCDPNVRGNLCSGRGRAEAVGDRSATRRVASSCATSVRRACLEVDLSRRNKERDLVERPPYASIFIGGHMQTIFNTLFVGAILAIGMGPAVAAAPASDPVIGSWKLNVAKSTFSPGPALKSQTRTYAESAQGIALTLKTTNADGKETTATLTFKDDGKPYPVTGNPDFDMVSVKRVDALTVRSTQMKGSATVGTGLRAVSKDGMTLTFAQKGTHANGVKYDDVLVYDRQ